jgi:hypothetical protein
MLAALTACGAPAYTYATDNNDQAYFKVPSDWPRADQQDLLHVQQILGITPSGTDGRFTWVRAYETKTHPSHVALLLSRTPVVYASVQNLKTDPRNALSLNAMRDLVFPVTPGGRQLAAKAGVSLPGFTLLASSTITTKDGVRGINEQFGFLVGGVQPVLFDQTVLTNTSTTKLYLLLVQCDVQCFSAHLAQIKTVVQSFTVRGS